MYELTESQALEVGGGGPGSDIPQRRIHQPGEWLDINSGPVEEIMPGIWVRVPWS